MGLFNFGKKTTVGIDIGTTSIKIVELARESGRFKLENYGILELSSGAGAVNIDSPESAGAVATLSDSDLVWGIKELFRQSGIKSNKVVASIPSFPTFTTVITIPYVSEDEIANTVRFEARKYIPVPLEDVQLDWSVINAGDAKKTPVQEAGDEEGGKKAPMIEVLLAAVPKEDIQRYKTIMKEAKLELKALEIESFAMIRALLGNDLSPACIVSIGGRSTSIFIVDNGFQRVSYDYEVGGFEISKIIAKSLNVSLDRAEELKKSYGLKKAEDNIIREAMISLIDMMVFETKKTISNYEDLKKVSVSKVLLVGGLANMPHFKEYFSEKLGREVDLGNPLSRVIVPQGIGNKAQELNATFAVAIGLAMREVK